MNNISNIRSELISIVGNSRLPIKTKRILIKKRLKTINTFIDLKPNKIYNQKKKIINKILSILPSIKFNVDLKKILTQELITDITDFESYPDIIFDKKEDDIKEKEYEKTFENCIKKIYLSNDADKNNIVEAIKNSLPNKEILIGTVPVESEADSEVESVESNESLNSDSDTEEESDCDEDSDVTNEEIDSEELESDDDDIDNTVNNLMEDLPNEDKIKLITKLTKYKLEHEFNMEAEKNRNMEQMEELAIKKLKVKNKYKLKKLENRK